MRFLKYPFIVLASCGWALGQEVVIDEATYIKPLERATEFLRSEKHRTKTTLEMCSTENCVWKTVETSVTEYEAPDKRRHYGFIETPRGMEPLPEYRFLGDKTYVKRHGSDWKVEETKAPAAASPKRSDARVAHRDLGIERVGLDEMRVFLRTAHVRSVINGVENESLQTIKSWLDRDGRFKKVEYYWKDARSSSRRTVVY